VAVVNALTGANEVWPAVGAEDRTWVWTPQHYRPTNRRDRLFKDYESAVPAQIGGLAARLGPDAADAVAHATARIAVLDSSATFDITALGGLLVRSESVASSKIERLNVSQRDLARALIGAARPRSIAARVAGNVRALQRAIALADGSEVSAATFCDIHAELMRADEHNADAGVPRTDQNWIGGSDSTPRDARFVPPRPELVPELLEDLAVFLRRSDMNAVVQAAVTHAQFETIHPFGDGNGRTGRALVHLALRRRGLATRTVVPVSTVLLADTEGYFEGLNAYRRGDLDAWVVLFAYAAATAADAGVNLATELREIHDEWRRTVRPRAGSAVAHLLDAVVRQPVVDIATVGGLLPDVDAATRHRAIARLRDAGVLSSITDGKRNQVWAASAVLDLLEEFERDLGRRTPPARS